MKNDLQRTKVNVIDCPAQSPDLNPIENVCGGLKTMVHVRRPSHLEELERFPKEEWAETRQETCQSLVEKLKQTTLR